MLFLDAREPSMSGGLFALTILLGILQILLTPSLPRSGRLSQVIDKLSWLILLIIFGYLGMISYSMPLGLWPLSLLGGLGPMLGSTIS